MFEENVGWMSRIVVDGEDKINNGVVSDIF
jgi:hypothetical protein